MSRGVSKFSASFLALLGIFPILTLFSNSSSSLIIIIAYCPAVLLWIIFTYNINRRHYNIDILLHKFIVAFVPGVAAALVCELVMSTLLAYILLGEQFNSIFNQIKLYHSKHPDADTEQMIASINIKRTFGLFLLLFCLSFLVAGVIEEGIKLIAGRNLTSKLSPTNRWKKNPVFILSSMFIAALGFATAENIGYALQSSHFSTQLVTITCRSLIATPIHILCGGFTGVELVKVDLLKHGSFKRVLYPAVIFHGLYDFQAFMMAIFCAPRMSMAGFSLYSNWISAFYIIVGALILHRQIKKLNLRSLLDQWDEQQSQSSNGIQVEEQKPFIEESELMNEIV